MESSITYYNSEVRVEHSLTIGLPPVTISTNFRQSTPFDQSVYLYSSL